MTLDVEPTSSAVRRNDIQGLRGVSALLVVAFHVWTVRTAGAVDVFFVVSGYLLLGSLIRQHDASGVVGLKRYAVGILRRLLPTALVVLMVTVAVAQFLLPEARWGRAINEAAASAAFVENYALIHYATDYLARDDVATPFASGWAISTQVQAYVLMAMLMWVIARIPAKAERRGLVQVVILGAATLASFAFAIWLVNVNQSVAYFSTPARLWEFTIGGLAAWCLTRAGLPKGARAAAGWLGLAMLLSTGLLLGATRLFPGWASLWPVAGALLILAAGSDGKTLGVGRVLAWRPLAWLGGISYGIYLWHGPLVVFTLVVLRKSHFGLLEGLGVMVAAILLAALSKATLEAPISRLLWQPRPAGRTFILSGVLIAISLASVGAWKVREWSRSSSFEAELKNMANPGGAVGPETEIDPLIPVLPRSLWAHRDVPDPYGDGCHADDGEARPLRCVYGPSNAAVTLAVVGSSHSAHWAPTVQRIAERRGWRVMTYTKSSCIFAVGAAYSDGTPAADCGAWNTAVMARLIAEKPDLVITLGTFGTNPETVPFGSVTHWRRLQNAGIDVLALRDTPWFPFDVSDCVNLNGPTSPRCALSRPAEIVVDLRTWPANTRYVDTRDWFCTATLCPPVIGNVLVYRDNDHLTKTFARTLDRKLEPLIDQALRDAAERTGLSAIPSTGPAA